MARIDHSAGSGHTWLYCIAIRPGRTGSYSKPYLHKLAWTRYWILHTLDNTIWIPICIVNHIKFGGIVVQSMYIAAHSGWHLSWPLYIAALQRWHNDRSNILLRLSKDILVDQYRLLRLSDDILVDQYVVLPTGQTYRSSNTYCCAYAMTYSSGNSYCCA